MPARDPFPDAQKTNIIYHWKCPGHKCIAEYIKIIIIIIFKFSIVHFAVLLHYEVHFTGEEFFVGMVDWFS